jgi:hypothetical protein
VFESGSERKVGIIVKLFWGVLSPEIFDSKFALNLFSLDELLNSLDVEIQEHLTHM